MTHLQEYVYTFDDTTLSPLSVVFRALSKRELGFIRGLENPTENMIRVITLEKALIKFINVKDTQGNPITTPVLEVLSTTQQQILSNNIYKVSTLTSDILESMSLNTKLALQDKFKTETWNCEECQRRGLDKERNCKKRDDYDDLWLPTFKVLVGNEEYRDCPMFYRDDELVSAMFNCYSLADKGILPDIGAGVDQTEFYQYAVDMVTGEINKQQAAAYDKK